MAVAAEGTADRGAREQEGEEQKVDQLQLTCSGDWCGPVAVYLLAVYNSVSCLQTTSVLMSVGMMWQVGSGEGGVSLEELERICGKLRALLKEEKEDLEADANFL